MTDPILITGGTGTLGRAVTQLLLDGGHEVRVLSRHGGAVGPAPRSTPFAVDLRSGIGLDRAVAGAGVIVHCASGVTGGDLEATGTLIRAAQRAGVPHLVYISIVGVDRIDYGYYRTKLAAERAIEESGLLWSLLRTTQFHDLILMACRTLARLPVMPVPARTSFQPLDASEVAARLVEIALGAPAGRVPVMGGPEMRTAEDLAHAYLRASGRHRRVFPVRLPGAALAGFRRGDHLAPGAAVGRITFEQFLQTRLGPDPGR
jgi:uncharacterized protein YbjT (DUF2867 family)